MVWLFWGLFLPIYRRFLGRAYSGPICMSIFGYFCFIRIWRSVFAHLLLAIYSEAPCIPHGSDRCVGGPDDDRRFRILFFSHHGSHFPFVVCIETDCCLPRAASVHAACLAASDPAQAAEWCGKASVQCLTCSQLPQPLIVLQLACSQRILCPQRAPV